MSLERAPSAIPGVRFGAVARHADERGSFRELWRDAKPGTADAGLVDLAGMVVPSTRFVQANLSASAAGVLRGLHLHQRQVDHWVVASGLAFVAVVDVRPLLSESGRPVVETRILRPDDWVVIPEGVAHGFLALEPLELIYFVTNWYDGSDELGFAWDDPAIGVPWPPLPTVPSGQPILSDRDAANPPLADLVARLREES